MVVSGTSRTLSERISAQPVKAEPGKATSLLNSPKIFNDTIYGATLFELGLTVPSFSVRFIAHH